MKNNILIFLCYMPQIYSGLDRFNVLLSIKLIERQYTPIFVYSESVSKVPNIREDIERTGAKIELIPSFGVLNKIKSIYLLFHKYEPIIVHSHFDNLTKLSSALFSIFFKSKYFVSFRSEIHPSSAKEFKNEKGIIKTILLRLFLRILLICSKNIFTNSNEIRNQFIHLSSLQSPKVVRLYQGVSLIRNEKAKTELRSFLNLPHDKILLCNISAFEYIKGLDVLFRALESLKNKYNLTNFCFYHIGGLRSENTLNKNFKESIILLANDLNIQNQVFWIGQRNDVSEILSAFDIYIHPSRTEGLPYAIMEAAVQKLPIIGSNVGGIPEIVRNYQNGFLFESENAEQLAECLYKLISNEFMRKEMGEKSYSIVCEDFNIEDQTQKLISYYLYSNH